MFIFWQGLDLFIRLWLRSQWLTLVSSHQKQRTTTVLFKADQFRSGHSHPFSLIYGHCNSPTDPQIMTFLNTEVHGSTPGQFFIALVPVRTIGEILSVWRKRGHQRSGSSQKTWASSFSGKWSLLLKVMTSGGFVFSQKFKTCTFLSTQLVRWHHFKWKKKHLRKSLLWFTGVPRVWWSSLTLYSCWVALLWPSDYR